LNGDIADRISLMTQKQDTPMLTGMPSLSHSEQEQAADRIRQLMADGMSSGEAIATVADEIRTKHQGDRVTVIFDDEDE